MAKHCIKAVTLSSFFFGVEQLPAMPENRAFPAAFLLA